MKSMKGVRLPGERRHKHRLVSLLEDFKYKKLEIDKKLDEIVNKKIIQIEKDYKKFKNYTSYFNNGYIGEKNKHDMPHGKGTLVFHETEDEDLYIGQFDSGLKHGIGKYTYFSGARSANHPFLIPSYAGEWFADSYHGLGKHLITDFEYLMIFEGTHTHDKKNGFGTYKRFNSDDGVCNSELIGYFTDGRGFQFIIEINRDDKGNLVKDVPSGLLKYDDESGSKIPLLIFNEIAEWEKIKPKQMDKDISDIYDFYKPYFNLDPFTEKFSDLKLEVKKNVIKLMFDTDKYFVKNSEDKSFFEFLEKADALNKVINQIGEFDKLVELKEKVEDAKKEFIIIEKKLKS